MLIVFKPNGKDTRHLWNELQRFGNISVTDFISEVYVSFDMKEGMDLLAIVGTCEQYKEVKADETQ